MRLHEIIIESRSNPEKNIKVSTIDVFKKYISLNTNNDIYVHFNNIEKVGVNLGSTNTYGPVGVYATPLNMASDYGLHHSKLNASKYVNILKLKPTAKVLNLDTVDISDMTSLVNLAIRFHKKKLKYKADYYTSLKMPTTTRDCWKFIQNKLYEYCNRRGKQLMYLENIFFRNAGYDAIIDNNSIINDNPGQIVFLSAEAFSVVETLPIRY